MIVHTETTGQDWPQITRWLCRRLAMLDGRLHALTPAGIEALGQTLAEASAAEAHRERLQAMNHFLRQLGLHRIQWHAQPRPHQLPMVGIGPDTGLCIVHGRTPSEGLWVVETPQGRKEWAEIPTDLHFCSVALGWREQLQTGALGMLLEVLRQHRQPVGFFMFSTFIINLLAVFTSLYSMQVYDRVIPSRGVDTLIVLTLGVGLSIVFELLLKFMRSLIMEKVVQDVDTDLSHRIFERLLKVRMDQFPSNVGTLASQLRMYESVRAFA